MVCVDQPQTPPNDDMTSFIAGQMNHGWGSKGNSGNRWFDKTMQVGSYYASDLICFCLSGPYMHTVTMAFTGRFNLVRDFLIGPLYLAWDTLPLVPVCAGSFMTFLSATSNTRGGQSTN